MTLLDIRFAESVPKEPGIPNEDAWLLDQARGLFAISDGVSADSFDSRIWAQMVAAAFVGTPAVNVDWINKLVADYEQEAAVRSIALPWYAQNGIARGSSATLLGAHWLPERAKLELVSVGDCLAVLVRDGLLGSSYPFVDAASFNCDPELLSTASYRNSFFHDTLFTERHCTTWGVLPGDSILLMTDALGQWLLRTYTDDDTSALDMLCSLESEDAFLTFVHALRDQGKIKRDDTTLVHLCYPA